MIDVEFTNLFTNAKVVGTGIQTAAYLAQLVSRGDRQYVMTSSDTREFLRCPSRWRNGYREGGSDSTEWGDLVDCLVTCPERFEKEFVIRPDTYTDEEGEVKKWNGNAKVCKEWLKKHSGLSVVTAPDHKSATFATERLFADRHVGSFLKSCTAKQVFVVGEYHDAETGITIPVKSLTDLVPDKDSVYGKSLGDFKTTRDAAPEAYRQTVFNYGYHIQAAWHMDLYVAATGEDREDFRHIIQENFPPFQTAGRVIESSFLQLGRLAYRRALKLYCQCLATGEWPGYDYDSRNTYQGWAFVEPLPYMVGA